MTATNWHTAPLGGGMLGFPVRSSNECAMTSGDKPTHLVGATSLSWHHRL